MEGSHIGEAVSRIFSHSSQNCLLDILWYGWIEAAGRDWFLSAVLELQSDQARVVKRAPSGDELVGDTSQRVLIALTADHPAKLLRCHVGRAAPFIYLFRFACVERDSNIEIGKEGLIAVIEEIIARFEVTMDDIVLVNMCQRLADLRKNRNRVLQWERLA